MKFYIISLGIWRSLFSYHDRLFIYVSYCIIVYWIVSRFLFISASFSSLYLWEALFSEAQMTKWWDHDFNLQIFLTETSLGMECFATSKLDFEILWRAVQGLAVTILLWWCCCYVWRRFQPLWCLIVDKRNICVAARPLRMFCSCPWPANMAVRYR